MISVSIILPIYNMENYLEISLGSLINQTLRNIEIICINDGSKDNSLSIIEKYLHQCLKSVINQTYKNLEIICINDGSKDNSLNILNEYLKKIIE